MTISYNEYNKEVLSLANSILDEALQDNDHNLDQAKEEINDTRLHETIDSHQWIIYWAYNLSVIQHSDNDEYYTDNFGTEEAGLWLCRTGLSSLHTVIAFWALYADVQEKLNDLYETIND